MLLVINYDVLYQGFMICCLTQPWSFYNEVKIDYPCYGEVWEVRPRTEASHDPIYLELLN